MTLSRWIWVGLAALCLAGCSVAPAGYVGRISPAETDLRSDPLGTGGGRPLVPVPASLGPILAVHDVPYVNGVAQDILLGGSRATAGENKIEVRIADTLAAGSTGGGMLTIPAPAAETVDDDLVRLFPGVDMRISPELIAGYGRGGFSYASGHLGTTNCVYAWQYSAARPATLFEGASGFGRATTSVRLRLCRTLSMTALLDIVQQMANASGGGADPVLGGAAAPEVYRRPVEQATLDQVRRSAPPRPRHRVAAVRSEPLVSGEARARADVLAGPRIPLPDDVAPAQTPGSLAGPPSAVRPPAGDLPMPPP